jgi:hypothetical protein
MRHWITSFLLLTMRPNVRHGGGMASLGRGKAAAKRAASRRLASLLAAPIAMLVAVAAATIPARAQTAVDLHLVLAVDVAAS